MINPKRILSLILFFYYLSAIKRSSKLHFLQNTGCIFYPHSNLNLCLRVTATATSVGDCTNTVFP